jgi:hypothetical protein
LSELSFRGYAAALVQGNKPGAVTMLEQLLGLSTAGG